MATSHDSTPHDAGSRIAIGRIRDAVSRWLVVVETWTEGADHCRGRFIFQSDEGVDRHASREGPPALHGRTLEDVVRAAYELPEEHLRTLLRSLS
jgi:hypothetical protein